MADAPEVMAEVAKVLVVAIGTAGSYLLGRHQARNRSTVIQHTSEHREREQIFAHYNDLIEVTREMNSSLRTELSALRGQMHTMQLEHATATANSAAEREECRIENERLKTDLRHLKADISSMKQELAEYQSHKS